MSEMLDIVDPEDRVIGQASRTACHGDPNLIHRVVHVMVFNEAQEIVLQLRGKDKKVQPGKWDSSVGGHVNAGETYEAAAARELAEELGIMDNGMVHLYDYTWPSRNETERVRTYHLIHNGPFEFQREEIQEVRFFSHETIEENLGTGLFTPNFEVEWAKVKANPPQA